MLLAEDSQNDIELFKHAVQRSAAENHVEIHLEITRDGAEAIDYLSGEGIFGDRAAYPFPDIVVLDLKMPRLSGLDVLKWLKRHEKYRRIPKILLSGSAEECDIEEAYRLGVNTYFQKPAKLEDLRELIHLMIAYWAHTQRPVIRHAFD
jgi:CheY-like chemotaxis protein